MLSSTDHLVLDVEILLTEPERTFSFCISELKSDF